MSPFFFCSFLCRTWWSSYTDLANWPQGGGGLISKLVLAFSELHAIIILKLLIYNIFSKTFFKSLSKLRSSKSFQNFEFKLLSVSSWVDFDRTLLFVFVNDTRKYEIHFWFLFFTPWKAMTKLPNPPITVQFSSFEQKKLYFIIWVTIRRKRTFCRIFFISHLLRNWTLRQAHSCRKKEAW